MAKRGKNPKRGAARLRLVHNNEAEQRVEVTAEVQPLMAEIRARLRDDDPISLLSFISTIVAATDGRHGFQDTSPVALEDLVDTLIDIDIAETTAALHVLASLAPGDAIRARVTSALERRRQPMPGWLEHLSETTVTNAARIGFATEPGQNFLIEYRWPGGQLATYVIFDEGRGRGVKDAFPAPDPIEVIAHRMRDAAPRSVPFNRHQLDLVTARATIAQSLADGAARPVDEENDTWPSGRPIVEWLLSLMPSGGTAHPSTTAPPGPPAVDAVRPDVGIDVDAVIDGFADSVEAHTAGIDLHDVHDRAALMAVVEYAGLLGSRDPLTWTPAGVQDLLEDYLPSLMLPDPTTARRIQDVLEAFLAYSAAQRTETRKQKAALLHTVREVMPGYLDTALSPQAQGLRQALIDYDELIGGDGDFGLSIIGEGVEYEDEFEDYDDDEDDEFAEYGDDDFFAPGLSLPDLTIPPALAAKLLGDLAHQAGGTEALEGLDEEPLPDEVLDLGSVPEDIQAAVETVDALLAGFADEYFDEEFRTATRRFLVRAAAGDPRLFRGNGRPETAAAAIAWTIGRGNELVGTVGAPVSVAEIMEFFEVRSSPAARAKAFINAVDTASSEPGGPVLGSPELLVSSLREAMVRMRDDAKAGRISIHR